MFNSRVFLWRKFNPVVVLKNKSQYVLFLVLCIFVIFKDFLFAEFALLCVLKGTKGALLCYSGGGARTFGGFPNLELNPFTSNDQVWSQGWTFVGFQRRVERVEVGTVVSRNFLPGSHIWQAPSSMPEKTAKIFLTSSPVKNTLHPCTQNVGEEYETIKLFEIISFKILG